MANELQAVILHRAQGRRCPGDVGYNCQHHRTDRVFPGLTSL